MYYIWSGLKWSLMHIIRLNKECMGESSSWWMDHRILRSRGESHKRNYGNHPWVEQGWWSRVCVLDSACEENAAMHMEKERKLCMRDKKGKTSAVCGGKQYVSLHGSWRSKGEPYIDVFYNDLRWRYWEWPLRLIYFEWPLRLIYFEWPLRLIYLEWPLCLIYFEWPLRLRYF